MGKDLGLRISESLQKRGMTQKELAGRIGLTEAVISRYISGDRECISEYCHCPSHYIGLFTRY